MGAPDRLEGLSLEWALQQMCVNGTGFHVFHRLQSTGLNRFVRPMDRGFQIDPALWHNSFGSSLQCLLEVLPFKWRI
jgi:hypothetical protein